MVWFPYVSMENAQERGASYASLLNQFLTRAGSITPWKLES